MGGKELGASTLQRWWILSGIRECMRERDDPTLLCTPVTGSLSCGLLLLLSRLGGEETHAVISPDEICVRGGSQYFIWHQSGRKNASLSYGDYR